MCGISVVITPEEFGYDGQLAKMSKAIESRGMRGTHTVELAQNIYARFEWLPVSPDNQPQPYKNMLFNGFISNYRELAAKYDIDLRSDSDTELLGSFLYKFGLEKLDELNGFFAVVWYDHKKKQLHRFTDRYGIKQLYEYTHEGTTYICSEVKGILAVFPDLPLKPAAVADWKHSLGVMTNDTIYEGIRRVESLPFDCYRDEINIDYTSAKLQLKKLLEQSFRRNQTKHKTACYLSGGVDSGILAANLPDICLSMDYQEKDYSEAELFKVNSHGQHFTRVHNSDLKAVYIPRALDALDDLKVGSCYTNYALAEMAKQLGCRVVYSGAGSDELFSGYTHRYNREIEEVIKRTSHPKSDYATVWHKQYDWLYLRGILVVEDRMAGAHTLETRYPFLDNDLVDFVLSLPEEFRREKRILKDVAIEEHWLKPAVAYAKKRGFSNPVTNEEWVELALAHKTQK